MQIKYIRNIQDTENYFLKSISALIGKSNRVIKVIFCVTLQFISIIFTYLRPLLKKLLSKKPLIKNHLIKKPLIKNL